MSTLLLRFSGELTNAALLERLGMGDECRQVERRDLGPGSELWRTRGRHRGLALVGEPPTDEIGYWLAPMVALATRPERVASIDWSTQRVTVASRRRFLSSTLPATAVQMAAAGAALCAQRALLLALSASPPSEKAQRRPGRRRILYLRTMVGTATSVGGSITHTHEVIRALRGHGVELETVTTDRRIGATAAAEPDPPCRWHTVPVPRALCALPASAAFGGDLALLRAGAASARRADFIYQRHDRFSIVGALLARLSGRPLFLEFNGSEAWVAQHWSSTHFVNQLRACEDASLRSAARIIVVSAVERTQLERRGIDPARIVLNPCGVDPTRFAQGGGAAVRSELGISPQALLYGFVGTFGPWHGVPTLVQGFSEIADRRPEARLLLVGSGDELPMVKELVDRSRHRDRFHLVSRVAPTAVPAHLDACDVLVAPHVWKEGRGEFFGSPTKVFEYMAAGKAIAASRLGQIGEVLADGESALLVPPGDVQALIEALAVLGSDAELRARLGRRARRDATERHTWSLNARRVLDAYAELSSSAAGAA